MILDFGFWIDPTPQEGTGHYDFKFLILDFFHPLGTGHEPKESKIGNLKSKIGTVRIENESSIISILDVA
ncbi:hypothetical protein FACHB389_31335 [Nostoc calcicola FACHB-389]|nr:hypothetical protein [Nostoc calcicola FACHB-3891]OKH21914.1 hypothetical protein FACHB389_31335 [Nostoc calcicola FACHB-389]